MMFIKVRIQLFFSRCFRLTLDVFFPLNGIHASSVTVSRSEKPDTPLVLLPPVKWLHVLDQHRMRRCNSYPCMQEFALGVSGWVGTCNKGRLSHSKGSLTGLNGSKIRTQINLSGHQLHLAGLIKNQVLNICGWVYERGLWGELVSRFDVCLCSLWISLLKKS